MGWPKRRAGAGSPDGGGTPSGAIVWDLAGSPRGSHGRWGGARRTLRRSRRGALERKAKANADRWLERRGGGPQGPPPGPRPEAPWARWLRAAINSPRIVSVPAIEVRPTES